MIAAIALTMLLGASTDQTVDVKKGVRLEVHTFTGDVNIKVWNRDAVRIEADHSDRQTVEIRPGEQSLVVRGQSRIGPMSSIDYTITVPAWMAVNVSGMGTDVVLDGVGADVNVETTRGDIHLRGGSGFISLKSVQGSITIERAKGRIEAQTVNDNVHVSDATGDLTVGTTNGSIVLERIDTAQSRRLNGQRHDRVRRFDPRQGILSADDTQRRGVDGAYPTRSTPHCACGRMADRSARRFR